MKKDATFSVEEVYRKGYDKLTIITDPETGVQYLQSTVATASGTGVALTPLLQSDGTLQLTK